MPSIRLKINEKTELFENQKYLEKELNEINKGQADFLELDKVEQRLEQTIQRHEDSL